MRRSKLMMLFLLFLLVMVWGFYAATARADSFSVFVGYADNLRPSGFFPTPWLGNPNVVSQTPVGETLDTGAIRIDNTDVIPITISGFKVSMLDTAGNPVVFTIWNPLTIPAGKTGIFTQTVSFNFDSSDFGFFGAGPVNVDATHPLGGFTNPQNAAQVAASIKWAPVVTFDENGNPQSFTDSGHILDTFGYDLINLPPPGGDGNESINWLPIGQGGTRGGAGVPEPSTMFLIGSGLIGLAGYGRKKFFRK